MRDKALLVGAALLVCVLGVGVFFIAIQYHVSTLWIFLAVNSIGFTIVVARQFRGYWKTVSFFAFFALWVLIHTLLLLAALIRGPWPYWLPVFGVELFLGYLAAYWLFGLPKRNQ
jgi:hypothetical protein